MLGYIKDEGVGKVVLDGVSKEYISGVKDTCNNVLELAEKEKEEEDKKVEEAISEKEKHLQNDINWFKGRMNLYKESFFKVCDIVEHSDCAEIIKKLIEEERKKY